MLHFHQSSISAETTYAIFQPIHASMISRDLLIKRRSECKI
ncbi:hypothetical protein E2C01_063675 [Portunus trituberculatus]|uniref:Uncharacterized protein n=1 Tax=Portunus trituberculatus TaxID=210409 RepID=A0A5B7HB34_PORTR|nr:hypothetical protein [Portunus trituberculatus]